MQGEVMKGAIAMLVMGAAFIPLAFGLSLITDLNFGNVVAMAAALLILTVAMVGLGALMMSGIGAAAFFLGAAALVVLGASLIIFGLGLQAIGSGMEQIVGSIGALSEDFTSLSESIDYQQMLSVAGSIAILAASLAPMILIAPLASWGIGLLGASFIILGTGLTLIGGGVQSIVEGFQKLGDAMTGTSWSDVGTQISGFFGMLMPYIPSMMLLAPVVGLLGLGFSGLGVGLGLIAASGAIAATALTAITDDIYDLLDVSDAFGGLALNLLSLAGGFTSLAGSLLLLTPFVPLLMLLGASGTIGQILGVTEVKPVEDVTSGGSERAEANRPKEKTPKTELLLQQLNQKFDTLIEAVKEGGDVNMDGKKVGDILGSGLMGSIVG
jgi:hypothetical protein